MKRVVIVLAALVAFADTALAGGSTAPSQPPVVVPGARAVDVRNTTGGLSRFTTIPAASAFRTYGGRSTPCTFTSQFGGVASNGDTYQAGQQVQSYRWIFIEGLPEAMGEPSVADTTISKGPISTAVRHFTVFCDTIYHFVGIVDVGARDPLFNPFSRLTSLYNGLQLEQPVVYRNPVVDRWGGLITRYPAWLAIQPSAWRPQRSNPAYWRGWTLYLLTTPTSLEFLVRFTPDPAQPSTPFDGVVPCVAGGSTPVADAVAFPAVPALPEQSTPGVNGPCTWTPPGPGSVTIQARITYRVTFWANGYTEALPDYVWSSPAVTVPTGELSAVNTNT
jgi:hypothetical protein